MGSVEGAKRLTADGAGSVHCPPCGARQPGAGEGDRNRRGAGVPTGSVRLSPLGQAALEIGRLGFAVFPLRPREKTPLTAHGHLDARLDEEAIRRWWGRHPCANVGLAIPPGLVVVDIDDLAALGRLKAEGRALPATVKSATGRGVHLFYRTEAEIRNAVKLFPGVDLRGVGGYVVAPPSIHPTGASYRWEVPLAPANLAEAPGWIGDATLESGAGQARPPEAWRQMLSGDVGSGKRNDTIASLAGHLLRLGVDPFVALELLLAWNAARCHPPLSEAEVTRTVDSVAGCELRRRRGRG